MGRCHVIVHIYKITVMQIAFVNACMYYNRDLSFHICFHVCVCVQVCMRVCVFVLLRVCACVYARMHACAFVLLRLKAFRIRDFLYLISDFFTSPLKITFEISSIDHISYDSMIDSDFQKKYLYYFRFFH